MKINVYPKAIHISTKKSVIMLGKLYQDNKYGIIIWRREGKSTIWKLGKER